MKMPLVSERMTELTSLVTFIREFTVNLREASSPLIERSTRFGLIE